MEQEAPQVQRAPRADEGTWHSVPWYHPMRWFGYSWRQWTYDSPPAPYGDQHGFFHNYKTHAQRANDVLYEMAHQHPPGNKISGVDLRRRHEK